MPQDMQTILHNLSEAFPACFNLAEPKPLKIGIGHDLLALVGVHPLLMDVARIRVRRVLTMYTGTGAYRRALIAGGPRYDLDGQPSGEVAPDHQAFAQELLSSKPKPKKKYASPPRAVTPLIELTPLLPELIAMATPGKIDITLKINALPKAKPSSAQTMLFAVAGDGRTVLVELKSKQWNNLKKAAESYPQWVAAITGKMGELIEGGFRLESPAVQVFEKKAKPEAAPPEEKAPVPAPKPTPAPVSTPAAASPSLPPPIERPKLSLKGRTTPS